MGSIHELRVDQLMRQFNQRLKEEEVAWAATREGLILHMHGNDGEQYDYKFDSIEEFRQELEAQLAWLDE